MIMGDNSVYPNLGGFDGHWMLEENNTIAHVPFRIDQNPNNPAFRDLGTIPNIETGISVLEETFIIDNGKEESNDLATLLDASVDPYILAEQDDNIFQNNSITGILGSKNMHVEQLENNAVANLSIEERSLEEGSSSKTTKENRKSDMNCLTTEKRSVSKDVGGGGLSAVLAKKQDHNAKERLRRMNLHASYVALGSLLPKSRRSKVKKRWTAPVIIDKVLEYIPELEKEIQQLAVKKNSILSVTENRRLLVNKMSSADLEAEATLTVSVNEIRKGDLILQICRKRDGANNVFSNFLQSIVDEGTCIVGASTIHGCEERECFHIHVQTQVNESSSAANYEGDYIAVLKEKLISGLS